MTIKHYAILALGNIKILPQNPRGRQLLIELSTYVNTGRSIARQLHGHVRVVRDETPHYGHLRLFYRSDARQLPISTNHFNQL